MKITLPPEKRQAAVDCFQKGLGYKRTAEAIGVSASTVRDWKRLWNAGKFSVNPMVSSLGPLTPSEKEIIRDRRIKGDCTETIARTLGRPASTVANFLHSAEFLPFLADAASNL